MTMTRDEYNLWQFERGLIDDLLARVERVEREILTELGYPTGLVEIYTRLEATKAKTTTAKRAKQRAVHAMHTLAFIQRTRAALALGQENAREAAYAALHVGLYAGDAALNAVTRVNTRQGAGRGGTKTGEQTTLNANARYQQIARCFERWHRDEDLQEEYGKGPAAYAQAQTGYSYRTVVRAAKRLGLRGQ